MKKIYSFLFLFAAIGTGFAQSPFIQQSTAPNVIPASRVMQLKGQHGQVMHNPNNPFTTYNFYLDYSGANADDLFYVFHFCTNFVSADTNLNFAGVTCNEIAGETDPADPQNTFVDWQSFGLPNAYPTSSFTLRFDTIFTLFSHENNSGNEDTIVISLNTTQTNGTPTNTRVWADTILTTTAISPSGNWLGSNALVSMYSLPNYTTTVGQKLAMVMYYKDPSKQDSLGLLGGSVDDGAGNSLQTNYQTSYMRYPPFITSITKCANITYTNGTYYSGQNWAMYAYVTADYNVGFNEYFENGMRLSQNVPNPFGNGTMIVYQLENDADVSMEITDITGKTVAVYNEGHKPAGEHAVQFSGNELQAGTYFYTLSVNGNKMTKKMNVVR